MPITFACPGCGKRFKAEEDKAGRKGKCPSCDAVFVIPAAEETAQVQRTAPHAEPRGRPEPEEEEDRDRTERRRRARDEGDNAEPRRRRPADEESDDGYEDENVRAAEKKKKPKSSTGLIVGLVGGAVALLLLLGGGIWLLVGWGGSSTVADDLKYLPENIDGIVVLNVNAFVKSDLYKRLRAETTLMETLAQQSGVDVKDFEDINRITFGLNMAERSFLGVLRARRALSLEAEATKGRKQYPHEAEYGRHKLRHNGSEAIAIPELRTQIEGPLPALRQMLDRKGTKASLSAGLQAVFGEVNFDKPLAGALDLQGVAARNQPGAGGLPFLGGPNQMTLPENAVLYLDVGTSVTGTVTGTCKSEQEAEALKKQLEGFLALFKGPIPLPGVPREVMDLAKNVQLTTNGNRVSLTVTADNNTLIEAAKKVPAAPRP